MILLGRCLEQKVEETGVRLLTRIPTCPKSGASTTWRTSDVYLKLALFAIPPNPTTALRFHSCSKRKRLKLKKLLTCHSWSVVESSPWPIGSCHLPEGIPTLEKPAY